MSTTGTHMDTQLLTRQDTNLKLGWWESGRASGNSWSFMVTNGFNKPTVLNPHQGTILKKLMVWSSAAMFMWTLSSYGDMTWWSAINKHKTEEWQIKMKNSAAQSDIRFILHIEIDISRESRIQQLFNFHEKQNHHILDHFTVFYHVHWLLIILLM